MSNIRKPLLSICRFAMCALACSLLAGCFFLPGRFQSELEIYRDGRFAYRYTGEVVFLIAEQKPTEWDDSMARCADSDSGTPRECSEAELSSQREANEQLVREEREAAADFAALTGYNPFDATANKALAEELMLYPGWKRVAYRGKGIFEVDYEISGTLNRDFAFPVVPQVQMAMPFVHVSQNRKGLATVSAAGLASPPLRQMIAAQTPQNDKDDPYYLAVQSTLFRTKGKFALVTDAEIVAADGAKTLIGDLSRFEWMIDSDSPEPKILLQLDIPQ